MMRWYKFTLRLRSLFRRARVEQELREELLFHQQRLTEEYVAKGMAPDDARYAALCELGGMEQIKEECRDMRRVNYIQNFIQDIHYGLRMLVRNPGFACTAILMLAFGLSSNITIFGFVDAALIKPLPYRDQPRLVAIFETAPSGSQGAVRILIFSTGGGSTRSSARSMRGP